MDIVAELRGAAACRPIDSDRDVRAAHKTHWLREIPGQPLRCIESACRETTETVSDMFDALITVIESRNSALSVRRAPRLAVLELLNLLSLQRAITHDAIGRRWESRYYPSSGGTHCIEPLIYASRVDDLPTGWYRQRSAYQHDVERVEPPDGATLIKITMDALRVEQAPSAIVFAVAEPAIHAARYPGGISLLWRDAGAFLAIAQLCATSLGLSAAIAGVTHELPVPSQAIPPFVVGAVGVAGVMDIGHDNQ